jgi:PAS domain S-box-containing protein
VTGDSRIGSGDTAPVPEAGGQPPRSRDAPGAIAPGSDFSALERYIATAPIAMAVTESHTHRFRFANPAFCRLMGADASEIVGREYSEAFPEPDGEGPLALLERAFTTGSPEVDRQISRRRAGDDTAIWSYAVWSVRDPHGTVTGLGIEVRDRTHEVESTRKMLEMADQIRQFNERLIGSALREQEWAERAEAAAKARSDFVAMMSHELRTPLNGIVGYLELLDGGYQGPLTGSQRDSLQRISRCASQLLTLVEDVLSFARVEAESLQPRPEPVDLRLIVRDVAAILKPLAAAKGVALHLDGADAPLTLVTDGAMVRQILLNLAGNAVKFTEAGEVRLELEPDLDDRECIRLSIRDTGIGILAEDLERVFEPFVQSEAVMTRRFGGTGLGLPISRAYATALGGGITAQSAPGQGATFVLSLPREAPTPNAEVA